MELTLLTCNYNTPELVKNLLKSTKHFSGEFEEFIVDTGEHYTYQHSDIHLPNFSHGEAVTEALDWIKTDYVLLVDSDIIFYKDIFPIFEKFKKSEAALLGNVSGDRGGKRLHPRVDPWFCFINRKLLKGKGIKFFDGKRTKKSRGTEIVYDVGSTLFEDVMKNDLSVVNFNGEGNYFKHYEGMSWRIGKYDPTKGDTDIDFGGTHNNKALYEYGLQVAEQYKRDVKSLN
jgi:glycosyltransferase involved in cell wall biosynthesis